MTARETEDGALSHRDATVADFLEALRNPTAAMIDAGLAATAGFLDLPGSAATVNREKMRLRYLAVLNAALAAQAPEPRGKAEYTTLSPPKEKPDGWRPLYEAIKHGDEKHRQWLADALAAWWAGKPVHIEERARDARSPSPPIEAVVEALREAAEQFEFYGSEHRAKAGVALFDGLNPAHDAAVEKAKTNERFAQRARAALDAYQKATEIETR